MPTELLQPSPKDENKDLYFSTPELAQRLDFVRHLAENSDYVPLIKGSAGTGKTHMANRLQSLAGENWVLCRIDANAALHPHDLVAQCARCFGVTRTKGRILEHLLHRLDDMRLAGRVAVILIDDAHLLPPETLVLLFGLHGQSGGDFPLVRVVLFADPVIDELLSTPRFESVDLQKVHSLQIPRLKAQQIPKFVKFVLGENAAGMNDALGVDDVVRLYRKSAGIPGRLLELIGNEVSGKGGTVAPSRRVPVKMAVLLAVLVLMVLVILVYQDAINRLFEPQAKVGKEPPVTVLHGEPAASLEEESPRPVRTPDRIGPSDPPAAGVIQAETVSQPFVPAIEPLVEQPAGDPTASPPPASEHGLVSPKSPEYQARAGATDGDRRDEPATAAAPRPADTPVRVAPKPRQATATKRRSEKIRPSVKPKDKGWRREAWLLAQNPESYTMQLLGVREEATLGRFIERYGLQEKAVYYKTSGKGKQPWFSLLYGVYPDRKAAEAARDDLPPPLRRNDVWFRRLGAVQDDIRANAK